MNQFKICLTADGWREVVMNGPDALMRAIEQQQPDLYAKLTAPPAEVDPNAVPESKTDPTDRGNN